MNSFKTLADHLATLLDTDLEGVERLIRWPESEGLCRRGTFMRKETFARAYAGDAVPTRVTAALVDVTALAHDHIEALAGVQDRVGFLLANITKSAPIASVWRLCGLSFGQMGQLYWACIIRPPARCVALPGCNIPTMTGCSRGWLRRWPAG